MNAGHAANHAIPGRPADATGEMGAGAGHPLWWITVAQARTPAFSFKQSQSDTASILCGITIRSCGYTIRIGTPGGPSARSSLDFAALGQSGGGAVKTRRGTGGTPGSLSGRLRGPAREIRPFQATPKPPGRHPQGIHKAPARHPQATLKIPLSYPQATLKPTDSQPIATPKLTQGLPKAYPKLT
jgi:hypothetical protein